MLQSLITQKTDEILMKPGEISTITDWRMREMMGTDMKRALGWVGYVDKYQTPKEREFNRVLET